MKICMIADSNTMFETLGLKNEKIIVTQDVWIESPYEQSSPYRRVEYDRDSTWHEYIENEENAYHRMDDDMSSELEVLFYEYIMAQREIAKQILIDKQILEEDE